MKSYEAGQPELVIIAEMTGEELCAPSGIYDPNLDKDLTNFSAIELIEQAQGSQGVCLNSNGYLSPEAAAYNSQLHRNRELTVERMLFAVISKRPPKQ